MSTSASSSSSYHQLCYFNVRGRAEFLRWILAASGLAWEDTRVRLDDWPAMKLTTPGGTLPYLVTPEGHRIGQALTIGRYLARKSALAPTDDLAAARCDFIAETVMMDAFAAVGRFKPVLPPEERAKGFEFWNQSAGPKYFSLLDQWVKDSGTGYLVGDQLTWADLCVAAFVNSISLIPEIKFSLDPVPEVAAFAQRIAQSSDKLQDYLKARPRGDFQF